MFAFTLAGFILFCVTYSLFLVSRLGQCVVENSWILDADRVRKILNHDLSYYEKIIDPTSYKTFQTRMANVKNKTWYSKQMSLDALTYILCSANIVAGLKDLRIRELEAAQMGIALGEADRKRLHEEMFSAQLKEWSTKSSKLAAVLNPEYGNFVKTCANLQEFCEREKREGRQTLGCGLDRACLYTAVSSVDPVLRCQLIEAQLKPDLRKAWFHPQVYSDNETKQWCHTWSMWATVESISLNVLLACFDEILEDIPLERFEGVETRDADGVRDQMVEDFKEFCFQVRTKFFRSVWITKLGEKLDFKVLRRRAKRYVYRFFVDRERVNSKYFWSYPLCFTGWAKVGWDSNGNVTFPLFSMYPADGTNPKRDLTEWEIFHCPWYIESDQWSVSFDQAEKSAFLKIAKGEKPCDVLLDMKFGPIEKESEACSHVEVVCQRQGVAVDRTRKLKAKAPLGKGESAKQTSSLVSLRPSKYLLLRLSGRLSP